MAALSKCKKCGAALTAGPLEERSSTHQGFTCSLRDIPTQICSKGCPGRYWYWLDFGVEVIEALNGSENFSQLKGFFKVRHYCRRCDGVELAPESAPAKFSFKVRLQSGREAAMEIEGPSRACPQCGARFIPGLVGRHDPYHITLCDAISQTLTQDLISD